MSPYVYANNDPLRYTDPSGMQGQRSMSRVPLTDVPLPGVFGPIGGNVGGGGSGFIKWAAKILTAIFAADAATDALTQSGQMSGANEAQASVTTVESTKSGDWKYYPPPTTGVVEGLEPAKRKTAIPGSGGKLRKRWKDGDGKIYEWDSQHGTLEVYDKRGKHLKEIDPETGEQTKGPDKGRKVEP